MTSRISSRMVMQQDLYELFHEYWNLFTAMSSYVTVLRHSPNIRGVEREATDEVARLTERLETSMEAIRVRILSLAR